MIRNFFVLAIMSCFFLFNGAAFALSSSDVEKFLRSMDELKPFFDTFEETESLTDSEDDDIDGFSFDRIKKEILEDIEAVEGIEEIVRKYGFSSPHQWAEIASQIIQVFVLSEMESAVTELQAEYEAMKADSNSSTEELEGVENIFAHLTREMEKLAGDDCLKQVAVTVRPDRIETPEKIVELADIAMYTAKNNGGNRFEVAAIPIAI